MNKKQQQIIIEGSLAEMANSAKGTIKVPVAKGVNIKALTEGDKTPMFVVVEALNEAVSANNRKYSEQTINDVARQINKMKPDAYIGHMKDEDRPFANPQSQTLWVGAKVLKVNGSKRLFVKGYILPYAKELKQYIKAAQAVGKSVAVSIYGTAKEIVNASGIIDVMNFNLESIDWARPSAAGIATMGFMSITREMEDNSKKGDYLKVIENYNTIREMVSDTIRGEIVREQDSQLGVIAEMLSTEPSNIRKVVSEMQSTIAEQERKLTGYFVVSELKKRQPTKSVRNVAETLVLAEMEKGLYNRTRASEVIDKVLSSKTMANVVSEMSSKIDINPSIGGVSNSRRYTKIEKKS